MASVTGYDCTDKPPSSYHVSKGSLCVFLFSIVLHCVDVIFDIYVAYSYFASSENFYGACSVVFILLPSVVIAVISVRMYLGDLFEQQIDFSKALWRVILCILGLPIQLATLIRTVDSLYFGLKSLKAEKAEKKVMQNMSLQAVESNENQEQRLSHGKKGLKEKYYIAMLQTDSDTYFLKVFEAYLESAPQQVLQMTFLIVEVSQGLYVHSYRQSFSIFFGFCSMALAMASYNKSIRLDQEDKQNVTNHGFLVHFLWHLLFAVSRILSISAVASLYPFWTSVAIGIHWLLMSICLAVLAKHNFCPSKFLDVLFAFVVGAVYIFNFLSLKDRGKKYYYGGFYMIFCVENVIATEVWRLKSSFNNWVYYLFTILPHVCFILGLIFMILYYKCFHPTLAKPKTSFDSNAQNTLFHGGDDDSS